MNQRKAVIGLLTVTVIAVGIGIVIGAAVNQGAEAASSTKGISPVDARARERDAVDCLWHRDADGASETGGVVLAARTGKW